MLMSDDTQTDAITCNIAKDGANNVPVSATAEVKAGSLVKFLWTDWQSDHPGPSMRSLSLSCILYADGSSQS
jgi:lytic cellulose monooxygenase (C1-hydroxylating)